MSSRRASWWVIGFLLLYFVVQVAGIRSIGLTDDDDFYIPAGISYAEWLGKALRFDGKAWSREGIDAAFTPNKEHPPFAKLVFGVSHFAFRGWLGPFDSARLGTVLFSTLTAALLLLMAIGQLGRERGLRVGGWAVLMLLTLPRFYFHSHAATLDVPVAAMVLASAAMVLRAERSRKTALLSGPVFGLAAATKLNAPFLLFAYLPFVVLTRWGRADREDADASSLPLPSIPMALVSMALLGPLVFVLCWPWLWFDFAKRVTEYVQFHLHHYGIHFLYFGTVYTSDPFAPWHAPFVMAASTVPLATTVLALAGLVLSLPVVLQRIRNRSDRDDPEKREGDLLLFTLLNVVVAIGVVAFAGTPIYGGEKLFMPFFPFWCLLAGYGADRLYQGLRELVLPRGRGVAVAAAAATLLSLSGAFLGLKFGAYGLSEYNGLVGGLRGATALGFERQYYDVAFRDLVKWLSGEAPTNLRVHFLPNNWEYVRTYAWYRRSGELRKDIQVVRSEEEADWIVLTHERRFARYADDLARYREKKVLREKLIDGTPIWTVLERR